MKKKEERSEYYSLGWRTLPSIIGIDKIVIGLQNKEKERGDSTLQ